jgi:hypothetical protein
MSYEMPFRLKVVLHESEPVRIEATQKQEEPKGRPVKNRYSLKAGSSRGNWPAHPQKNNKAPSSKGSRQEVRQRWVTQWEPEGKESGRSSLKKAESPPRT